MPHSVASVRTLIMLGLLALSATALMASEQPQRLSTDERRELSALQAELRDAETNALPIVQRMVALGPGANNHSRTAILNVLRSDARVIATAIRQAGDISGLPDFLEKQTALREKALANIKVLAKDATLDKAKEYHSELITMQDQYNSLQQLRAVVAQRVARRQPLKELYAQVADDLERHFRADRETSLIEDAVAFLGMDVATITQLEAAQSEPSEPQQARLWTQLRNRQIEAWNASQRPLMSQGEWDNLVAVNAYREALGLRPYEIDHRLLQAARQHSKEMADKGYFSHSSPTPETSSHTKRMSRAGYSGGYSENIANGARSGDLAFWMWFSSPPHHRNMMNAGSTQMGVGQWGVLWTQKFGRGKPLLPLSQEERIKQTTPKIPLIDPQ